MYFCCGSLSQWRGLPPATTRLGSQHPPPLYTHTHTHTHTHDPPLNKSALSVWTCAQCMECCAVWCSAADGTGGGGYVTAFSCLWSLLLAPPQGSCLASEKKVSVHEEAWPTLLCTYLPPSLLLSLSVSGLLTALSKCEMSLGVSLKVPENESFVRESF